MDLFKWFRRCFLCNKNTPPLKYIPRHGEYGESGQNYAYHDDCLKTVLSSPEDFSFNKVDRALCIVEELEYWRNKKAGERKIQEERRNKCQVYCKKYIQYNKRRKQ